MFIPSFAACIACNAHVISRLVCSKPYVHFAGYMRLVSLTRRSAAYFQSLRMQKGRALIQGVVAHFLWWRSPKREAIRLAAPEYSSHLRANMASHPGAQWLDTIVSSVMRRVHEGHEGKERLNTLICRGVQRGKQDYRDFPRHALLITAIEGGDLD
jgi:hypothetical protein